jgi:hypothetical protein
MEIRDLSSFENILAMAKNAEDDLDVFEFLASLSVFFESPSPEIISLVFDVLTHVTETTQKSHTIQMLLDCPDWEFNALLSNHSSEFLVVSNLFQWFPLNIQSSVVTRLFPRLQTLLGDPFTSAATGQLVYNIAIHFSLPTDPLSSLRRCTFFCTKSKTRAAFAQFHFQNHYLTRRLDHLFR